MDPKERMDAAKARVRAMHTQLGCEGCRWVDERALWKRPCCTYPDKLVTNDDGKCLVRESK